MAQFDLKNATIKIKDGYTGPTGALTVNLMAGYTTGAVTMTVDGVTGAVATGDQFTIGGETGSPTHTITAHTETSSNTTSITFTPAIASNVADNAVLSLLPHTLMVKLGEGNLTFNEKKNRQYVKDRGKLSTVRNGDEEPVDVKLDFIWEFLKANTGKTPTVEDVLKQRGEASNWVSSSADTCEPYAVDLEIVYTPPCTVETTETITLSDFRYEELAHNAKDGMVAVTGKCNVTEATIARAA